MLRASPRFVAAVTLLALVPLGVADAAIYRKYIAASEAQEVPAPPVPTGGSATGVVDLNTVTNTISVNVSFSSLSGNATLAHFHGFAAPGATAGVRYDLTSLISNSGGGAGTIIGSPAAYPEGDEASILAGLTYLNIHTSANGSGQVRDQMVYFQLPATNPVGWIALGSLILIAGAFFIVRRRQAALA